MNEESGNLGLDVAKKGLLPLLAKYAILSGLVVSTLLVEFFNIFVRIYSAALMDNFIIGFLILLFFSACVIVGVFFLLRSHVAVSLQSSLLQDLLIGLCYMPFAAFLSLPIKMVVDPIFVANGYPRGFEGDWGLELIAIFGIPMVSGFVLALVTIYKKRARGHF